jgi:uncharacterized membrane protein YdbT with pleckstrin-like domain
LAFPRRILDEDESVVLDLRPHWRRLTVPALVLPLVVGLGSYLWFVLPAGAARGPLQVVVVVAALAALLRWSLWRWLRWRTTRYVVTSRRVVVRTGVVSRNGRDVPLTRVNDVSFSHSVVERLFGSGTLVIESAGERGQVELADVPHVEAVQREVYHLMEDEAQRLRG